MGFGRIGNDIRRAAAGDDADVQRGRPDLRIDRQLRREQIVQHVDQLLDGGIAELRVGRVGHLAGGAQLDAQRSLGSEGEFVLGGFAVDKEA